MMPSECVACSLITEKGLCCPVGPVHTSAVLAHTGASEWAAQLMDAMPLAVASRPMVIFVSVIGYRTPVLIIIAPVLHVF